MNWIREVAKSFSRKDDQRILTIKRNPSKYIKVTSNEYYQFWAFFLAKPHVDLDCLFLSLSSLPERLRFAIYLKVLGSRTYVVNAIKEKDDGEVVAKIFDICGRNPLNREKAIFNIYKKLEYDFLLDFSKEKSVVIRLISYFLSMECSSEEGTYSILYGLINSKGLFEHFDQTCLSKDNTKQNEIPNPNNNVGTDKICEDKSGVKRDGLVMDGQNSLNDQIDNETNQFDQANNQFDEILRKIWEILLSNDLKAFITITDSMICLRDAMYHQLFTRAIEASPALDPSDIVSILAVPSNKSFYKIEYYRNKADISKNKDIKEKLEAENKLVNEQSYYDFLLIQNKLIEAQEDLKKEFRNKIEDLESKNKSLGDENASLRSKIKSIEAHLG